MILDHTIFTKVAKFSTWNQNVYIHTYIHVTVFFHINQPKISTWNQTVYIHTYIHVTLLLLDPHDIHHEGKKQNLIMNFKALLQKAAEEKGPIISKKVDNFISHAFFYRTLLLLLFVCCCDGA